MKKKILQYSQNFNLSPKCQYFRNILSIMFNLLLLNYIKVKLNFMNIKNDEMGLPWKLNLDVALK